ncbi:Trs23 protein [Candida orthopsilosis Co 90-125]|uniref:Trafficking protein particle complex subunit n=1 Tax=Candida orthopsilosis (strain 90-125) TaxID=1136231 RepID=H8X1P0_CANO9|nr:Trs23 protein [Candida orthopsilosis Co 90-125]CCG22445.1 Trs23 protein [Candida orthopsilosis Co 90-125]
MKTYSILILNKAGGLIYQNEIQPGLSKLTANDYLVLAGTLHGVHAIGSKLTSTINSTTSSKSAEDSNSQHNAQILSTGRQMSSNSNRTGLKSVETDLFNLYIFQTVSGLKFVLVTMPNLDSVEVQRTNDLFKHLYVAYSDYVMKNPFYSMDMPIKSSLFDAKVREILL